MKRSKWMPKSWIWRAGIPSLFISCLLFGTAWSADPVTIANDPNIFVNLSKKIVPSVVNISTLSTIQDPYGRGTPDDLFRRFFEDFFRDRGRGENGDPTPPLPGPPRASSLGTGFIIDASGLILTNNHVVAGADEIKIHFTEAADEKPTDGEVVGRDPELDLALIKVKSKRQMIPVVLGDSNALEVGEYVIAVGNPFGQGHSVTHGIISAKERDAPDFVLAKYLQTDAPINPGNSGGPLVNLKGEVIGINNAIDARAQGIGFAIPINLVKAVLPQLKSKGSVSRGYIGVLVNELTPDVAQKLGVSKDLQAPFVTHVYPGEPADQAGIKPYDVVLNFNGRPIHSSKDLIQSVTSVPVNEKVPVKVSRGGKELTLQVKIGQRPSEQRLATRESKEKKKKPSKSRPSIGMEVEELTPEIARELGMRQGSKGVVVADVAYGGPADQAGLLRGDVIVEVDKKPVSNVDQFYGAIHANKSHLLRVRRPDPQGRDAFVVIVLDLKKKS